jgi:hypothetical protein
LSNELDPTGAGDTFCGSTLAWLMQGAHPIMAAQLAIPLAAQMIEHLGPAALFSDAPAPAIPADMRVQINHSQVQRVSRLLSSLEEASPFPFVSPVNPSCPRDALQCLRPFGVKAYSYHTLTTPVENGLADFFKFILEVSNVMCIPELRQFFNRIDFRNLAHTQRSERWRLRRRVFFTDSPLRSTNLLGD